MDEIKIYKKVNTIMPAMIAGWPGMGSVALGVVEYLKRHLDATRFAEIIVDERAVLEGMAVEDGLARFPVPPKNTFYYSKDLDLIIFEGEIQLAGQAGLELMNKVIDLALDLKVRCIYTGAAFPMAMSHRDQSDVYAVANKESLKAEISKIGVKLMEGGHISGLNGLALGFAEKRGIDAICFLATMPQYAIGIPNPKASGAIIDILAKTLHFDVEMKELNDYIKDMDDKMGLIEEKVKDVFPIGEDEKPNIPSQKKVPGYVTDRIEKLFQEAKLDKKKALALKKELDRWDLYKLYEDRFLDLFKDNQ